MNTTLTDAQIDGLKRAANEGRQSPACYKCDWRFPRAAYNARNILRAIGFTVVEDDATGYVRIEAVR